MKLAAQLQKRRLSFPLTVSTLMIVSLWFYYRQNFAGQIGGEMSIAKLLWLDYTLVAWFIVPFFVWRSSHIGLPLRRIYGVYLAGFVIRGAVELWMLYVTVSWLPPYGITHDLFSIALITALLATKRRAINRLGDSQNSAARRFLTSIRLGLVCEMIFAWLFYRAIDGEIGIYFASDDAHFAFINRFTLVIVVLAYLNLGNFLWRARGIFFPIASERLGEDNHSYEGTSV
jgi:hypothetical protein